MTKYLVKSNEISNFEILKLAHKTHHCVYKANYLGWDVFLKEFNIKQCDDVNENEFQNFIAELETWSLTGFSEFKGIYLDMFPLVYVIKEFYSPITLGDVYRQNLFKVFDKQTTKWVSLQVIKIIEDIHHSKHQFTYLNIDNFLIKDLKDVKLCGSSNITDSKTASF